MIRADHHVVSKAMYAFDPTSWEDTDRSYSSVANAVWFKRKGGVLTATMGRYSFHGGHWRSGMAYEPKTYEEAVAGCDDNTYGGGWHAMWDGSYLITNDPCTEPQRAEILKLLSNALTVYPEVPRGYDGWWTFPKSK